MYINSRTNEISFLQFKNVDGSESDYVLHFTNGLNTDAMASVDFNFVQATQCNKKVEESNEPLSMRYLNHRNKTMIPMPPAH